MTPAELNKAITQAMKNKDKNTTAVLRQIKQLVVNHEKNTGKEADETVVTSSAKHVLKSTLEEADIRTKNLGPEDERAKMLYEQAKHIEEIIPKEMSSEELEPYVRQAIKACNATSMRDMKRIISEVSRTAPAAFDNKTLSAIAKELLLGKAQ
jgi:uncharacterized protein YqeY